MSQKNESELLFEEYLAVHGYTNWSYEAPIGGKRKNPDYKLEHNGLSLFFEVKEFNPPTPPLGFSSNDPHKPIRAKIHRAVRQFKEYKEHSCSIVLANPKGAIVRLEPAWIFGSMLGNLGIQIPIEVSGLASGTSSTPVFLGGGMMIDDLGMKPYNTTISSIIVLGTYSHRRSRIELAIKHREAQIGRKMTVDEVWNFFEDMPPLPNERRVRAEVYENPYARMPLDQDLFTGPLDVRWAADDASYLRRTYIGAEVIDYQPTNETEG